MRGGMILFVSLFICVDDAVLGFAGGLAVIGHAGSMYLVLTSMSYKVL